MIEYSGHDYPEYRKPGDDDKATIISTVDAGKIVLCAAPFLKVLQTELTTEEELDGMNNIEIGTHLYRVANFGVQNILKLLVKKSTKLTDVRFNAMPEIGLVRALFEKNNIKKFKLNGPKNGWYCHIPTQTIQEFGVQLFSADTVSFQGVGVYSINRRFFENIVIKYFNSILFS